MRHEMDIIDECVSGGVVYDDSGFRILATR